nr:MAG TPA: hypothetical protein [Caudoviricetes sp.]
MTGNAPELITATIEQAAALPPCITTSAQGAAKKCAPSSRTWKMLRRMTVVRLVIDMQEDGDLLACKETVAMLLEPIGRVRIVQIIVDGKEEKR